MSPEEIKHIRTLLGITQEAFGRLVGVTVSTVNRWEKGSHQACNLAVNKIKSLSGMVNNEKQKL